MPNVPLLLFKRGEHPSQSALAALVALLQQLTGEIGGEHEQPTGPLPHGHVSTRLSDDGRIETEYGTVPMRVSDAIKNAWPRELWTDAGRITYLEASGWSPTAERNTLDQAGGRCNVPIGRIRGHPIVSEDSVGLFQVNVCAWPYTRAQMLDPDQNAAAGYAIYRQQGWGAWVISAETLGLLE